MYPTSKVGLSNSNYLYKFPKPYVTDKFRDRVRPSLKSVPGHVSTCKGWGGLAIKALFHLSGPYPMQSLHAGGVLCGRAQLVGSWAAALMSPWQGKTSVVRYGKACLGAKVSLSGQAPGAPHGRSAARDSRPVTEWYQSRLAACFNTHLTKHALQAMSKQWHSPRHRPFIRCRSNGAVLGIGGVKAMAQTSGTEHYIRASLARVVPEKWAAVGRKARTVQGVPSCISTCKGWGGLAIKALFHPSGPYPMQSLHASEVLCRGAQLVGSWAAPLMSPWQGETSILRYGKTCLGAKVSPSGQAPGAPHGRSAARDSRPVTLS
ncbi:hypothetical protein JCGZ_06739 [Jatropha curcas]|uniref:Uncharacterized protein n=1 Tax=Jatropha curcas TaxID=180498 RepID=A0A067KYF9_JATCU|nr:hypothetical protein JCGZ_06739 [Jatropha curcas]